MASPYIKQIIAVKICDAQGLVFTSLINLKNTNKKIIGMIEHQLTANYYRSNLNHSRAGYVGTTSQFNSFFLH